MDSKAVKPMSDAEGLPSCPDLTPRLAAVIDTLDELRTMLRYAQRGLWTVADEREYRIAASFISAAAKAMERAGKPRAPRPSALSLRLSV